MTDRELMQQALDALEHLHRTGDTQVFDLCYAPELIPALRERLAQPEQEPFGYFQYSIQLDAWVQNRINNKGVAFYTTPSQREWQGLTKEEARELCVANVPYVVDMVAALEAKLKEKNNG